MACSIRFACSAFTTLLLLLAFAAGRPLQASMVTYTWQTDSSFGAVPSLATFQVELATVQTGTFGAFDIQNIDFHFPGIGPLTFTTGSSIGLDNAVFVDTTTGALSFHDANQGLAAIAYEDALFGNIFLSILIGNPSGLNVADTYNAIDGGPGSLGSGQGHWNVSGYSPPVIGPPATPEPGSVVLVAIGAIVCGLGSKVKQLLRVRHQSLQTAQHAV